jgi:hypothetical protein
LRTLPTPPEPYVDYRLRHDAAKAARRGAVLKSQMSNLIPQKDENRIPLFREQLLDAATVLAPIA